MRNKEVRNCCINHFQVQRSIHQRHAWSSCPVRVPHCWMVLGLQLGKSLSERHWVLHLAIFCFKQPSHCCKKKSNSQWKLLRVSCNTWGDLQQPSWASCWWQPVYIGVRSRAKGLSRRGQGSSLGHTQPINRLRGWWQMPNSQEETPLSLSLLLPLLLPTQNSSVFPISKEHPLFLNSGLYFRGLQASVDSTSYQHSFLPFLFCLSLPSPISVVWNQNPDWMGRWKCKSP